MFNQRKSIVSQNVGRIRGEVMRLRAVTMPPKVRHYDAVSERGDFRRMPVPHPIHHCRREKAMDQNERTALAHLAISKLQAIAAAEILNRKFVGCHHQWWRSWYENVKDADLRRGKRRRLGPSVSR